MTTQVKTKFAGRKNPFTGEKVSKRAPAVTMAITDDPLPTKKVFPPGKYDAMFQRMKPGQSLRVPSTHVNTVGQGLRKWLKNKGDTDHVVRTVTVYEGDDDHGRVWLLGASA